MWKFRAHAPIRSGRDRLAAWLHLLFADAGFLRLFWKNRREFAPGAWRMNQPFPRDIDWAKAQGIRTIISARHDSRHGGHALEAEAAAKSGIRYIVLADFPVFSREAPYRSSILEAARLMESVEKPLLIHCKSGADRAGFLAALYRIVVERVPVAEARHELSLRHLHFRNSKTGALDAVFDAYLRETAGSSKPFLAWVAEDYDPARIMAEFRPTLVGGILGAILRRE